MISPEYYTTPFFSSNDPGKSGILGPTNGLSLDKLFEDPEERESRIQSSIARSRLNKKR